MQRLLALSIRIAIFLLLCAAMRGHAQAPTPIPITGNVSMITGAGAPYATVSVWLANCPAPASIPGYAAIAPQTYTLQSDGTGQVNGTIWSNDKIDCNGTTGASQYMLQYLVNGTPTADPICYQVTSSQGIWNLNTQQSITCGVTPPNPQDATFNNVIINGFLQLPGNPTQPLQAAPKQYVDAAVANYLPLSGGTLSGNLTLNTLNAAIVNATNWAVTNFTTNFLTASKITAPGVIQPSTRENAYPGNFSGVAELSFPSSSPVIPYGAGGSFDAGETRDMKIIRTYGTQAHEYYMFYTGAAQTGSPYNPTIGLAHSDDGLSWTKDGQVIPATGSCGGVFSPGVFYDWNPTSQTGTKNLYLYVSCIASASQWYSGPINVYTVVVTSPAAWTSPSSYVWQSGPTLCGRGQAGCSTGQTWEGSQGSYAPDVILVNGTYEMFYASSDGSSFWDVGVATSLSPLGPWTKYASNPVTASHTAEEPAIVQFGSGGLAMLSDTIVGGFCGTPNNLGCPGISIYYTASTTGITTPWQWSFVQARNAGSWTSNHIGSQSVVQMPNGDWLVAFGANSGGTDQIGTAILRFRHDVEAAYGNSGAAATSYQDLIYNSTGGYPILARYTGQGFTFIGDASNSNSGELILGDIGTLTANNGIRRSSDGTANAPGSWIAIDGYNGVTVNVGNAAFGAKTQAVNCTVANGCLMKIGITISQGIGQGTGVQHIRFSGCTTAASAGAVCTATGTWGVTWNSASYTPSCTGEGIGAGVPLNGGVISKNTTQITYQVVAGTSAAAQFLNIDCIAMHD